MDEIKVSVLCAAYNHEKYIRQCLEGFIMQKTNFKYEVLIHDDASTDNTAQIIREYEKKYPDIIKPIYQTENQYSKGIKITTGILLPFIRGQYVALCEGDDFWTDENKLQLQVETMEAHPECKMCVHTVKDYYETQEKSEYYPPAHLQYKIKAGIIKGYDFIKIAHGYIFQTSSYFFDATTFKAFAKENPTFKQISPVGDVCFLLYFGDKAPVYYIEACMSCYRRNSIGSWSQKIGKSNQKEWQNYSEKVVALYTEFDKYTNGKYHDLMLVQIFYSQGNYKAIAFSKELKRWRKGFSIKKRIYFLLRGLFPRLIGGIFRKYRSQHND